MSSIFVGVPQSHLAGSAILVVVLVLAFFIMFGKEQVSFGQKVGIVLVMLLMALPTILLTLFQLNCVVTGAGNGRWWCSGYAWLVTALIVVYCVLLVVAAVLSFSKSQSILAGDGFAASAGLYNSMAQEFFANMEGGEGAPPGMPKPPSDVFPEAEEAAGPAAATGPASRRRPMPAPPAHMAAETFTTGGVKRPADAFQGAAGPVMKRPADAFQGAASGIKRLGDGFQGGPSTPPPPMPPADAALPPFEGFTSKPYASV